VTIVRSTTPRFDGIVCGACMDVHTSTITVAETRGALMGVRAESLTVHRALADLSSAAALNRTV